MKSNLIGIGVFVFFFLKQLLYWLPKDISNGVYYWVYTDWLIDYSSGFVRRGLLGELISFLSNYADTQLIIAVLVWIIYSAVVFGFIRLIYRSIHKIGPTQVIALLFLPCLLPFYLYDHAAFGRKELIGFLVLFWHLNVLKNSVDKERDIINFKKYTSNLLPLTMVLIPAHILIHESAFLLFVPTHFMITLSMMKNNDSFSISNLTLFYLPSIITLLIIVFVGRPSFDVALNICKKWELAGALESNACDIDGKSLKRALPGSITALPWTINQAISLTMKFSDINIISWIANILIFGSSTMYICASVIKRLSGEYISTHNPQIRLRQHILNMLYRYFLLPLVVSAPLYLLGVDIGRWFAVSCIIFVVISLSNEVNYLESNKIPKTNIITNFIKIAAVGLGILFILLGLGADKLGLSGEGFSSTQFLTIFGGLGFILFGYAIHNKNYLINQISHFEETRSISTIKIFILLSIIFMIRMPHCCNDGYKILSEPLRSLIHQVLGTN